jgi:hypothetical protein
MRLCSATCSRLCTAQRTRLKRCARFFSRSLSASLNLWREGHSGSAGCSLVAQAPGTEAGQQPLGPASNIQEAPSAGCDTYRSARCLSLSASETTLGLLSAGAFTTCTFAASNFCACSSGAHCTKQTPQADVGPPVSSVCAVRSGGTVAHRRFAIGEVDA